jgi:phosphomannomutase
MVTASHLPADRNGFKFFTSQSGGFTKGQIQQLLFLAKKHAQVWFDRGTIPPTSGENAVFCSAWVDWMPLYESKLKQALRDQVGGDAGAGDKPLEGLKLVLNSGHGSGGFFHHVLMDLGADVSASLHIEPDSTFPAGYIPNPEHAPMMEETLMACANSNADLGIMFDTDADRCGFVAPRKVERDGTCSDYEPLNRNRLIALLGVLFSTSSPGCAIVTDSVTSNGLADFLTHKLGLVHVRYLKGYANVINKARELTEAEVAIETSGHCAMKENGYLDDGTYTAVKIIGFLAREKAKQSTFNLLDSIAELQEMEEVSELRMSVLDGSLESTQTIFNTMSLQIEAACCKDDVQGPASCWALDRENLEGVRVSTGEDGGFFMLRVSLHDPVISLQVEAPSKESAHEVVIEPLLKLFQAEETIKSAIDFSALD